MADRVRDRRERPWSWFDDEVIKGYGRDLGPYGIAVYMALLTFADSKNRTCFPSMQQLAEMTAMSRRQVINSIQKLEGLKLIRKRPRHNVGQEYASNLYTILTPSGGEYGAPPSAYHSPPEICNVNNELSDEVVNTVHQGSEYGALGGAYGAHELDVLNQSKEIILAESTKTTPRRKKKEKLPPPDHLDPSENLIAWHQQNFVEYDLGDAIESCLDHYRKKGEEAADYEAAVRNWFKNGEKYGTLKKSKVRIPKFQE